MASKGGKTSQIVGYKYTMAFHMGLGRGPIDELIEIRAGDLVIWQGSLTESGYDTIDAPNVFGGDEKEGGISGTFKLLMGEPTQVVDDTIVSHLTPDLPVPGWRGVATLFYYGQIGSNNPYPKPWKVRLNRSTKGWENDDPWYVEQAQIIVNEDLVTLVSFDSNPLDGNVMSIGGIGITFVTADADDNEVLIGSDVSSTITNLVSYINFNNTTFNGAVASGDTTQLQLIFSTPTTVVEEVGDFISIGASIADIKAMNPAHIIYECVTNTVWGRGLPAAFLDDSSFRIAADTLVAEGFGMCIRWNRQEDVAAFVQTIINHIGAALFIDRTTGLLTLTLIRDDYDSDALTTYDFGSGLLDITEDASASADTSYNEVIVKYTSPLNGKQGQVRVHNLASFESIGAVISTTVEYNGCPTATLAGRLAQRDLRVSSSDLRRLKLKMDRRALGIKPGGVFKIHAPSRGIDSMVLRAGDIEDATLTDGAITVTAVQDIFTLDAATYLALQPSYWVPPPRGARVIAKRDIGEMTYFDAAGNLPPAELGALTADTGVLKIFAASPASNSVEYVVATRAGGELLFAERSTAGFDSSATLTTPMGVYTTDIEFTANSTLVGVFAGQPVKIGEEYCRIDDIDFGTGTMTIARGCIDTIPAAHSIGATIWFQTHSPTTDFRDYATSEIVGVKLLTRTTSDQLDATLAPIDYLTIGGRQGRPYPPGDVRMNGVPFGTIPLSETGSIVITWTHRDRVIEGNTLLEHGAASTGPEPGTTYTVRAYGSDGTTLLRTATGITGTIWTYSSGNILSDGDPSSVWIELEAVRDGFVSWQYYRFRVTRRSGFDTGFDFDFDGTV